MQRLKELIKYPGIYHRNTTLQVLLNRSLNFKTFFAFRIVRNTSGKLKLIKVFRFTSTKVVKDCITRR